jgi:hypothetical protein
MNSTLIESLKQRRTQYALGRNVSLDKDALTQRIKEAIRHTPSSFNSQSSRAVILFGEQSEKFWALTKAELAKIVPAEAFTPTAAKLDSFAAGIGTVLFYAGIDPRRAAGNVSRQRYGRLAMEVKRLLAWAIERGGTTLRDFISPDGAPGYFFRELMVYGRAGEPCRVCNTPIRQVTLGQRSTFWCPHCQR